MANEWHNAFDTLRAAIDTISGLEESPAPFDIQRIPQTLTVGAQQAFCVHFTSTQYVGDRGRDRSRDQHQIRVSIATSLNAFGSWQDGYGAHLSVEQAIRDKVIDTTTVPSAHTEFQGLQRIEAAGGEMVVTTLSFVLEHTVGVG